jgi:signal transduction histidine kinase/CheY-like chemotaxis protein
MTCPLFSLRIQYEHDVVTSRQRTREIAEGLGFDAQQQTRLATAVSEIVRNALGYGGGGVVDYSVEGATSPQLLTIVVSDAGRGFANPEEVLNGNYRSTTGLGLGIVGARRLMDKFALQTSPGQGTRVTMGKLLPRKAPLFTAASLAELIDRITRNKPRALIDEFREQNLELLRTLDELRARQDELLSLNQELEDTNRGVVALYAELDEKADYLKRADEMKSRFLSNMSHEFRTPLSSILALSRLLLERTDGDLAPEQEVQVTFIRKSAESLFELVNDLLDLAKVQAGKTVVHAAEFEVTKLFGALRGMLRPLLVGTALNLVFDDPADMPLVFSDEGKVSQILRNFIANALKFTENGEVRVSASFHPEDQTVSFCVKDTGVGIDASQLDHIFQEFVQIDGPIQRKFKGTGLGLPLSRRLAELLGGTVSVESQLGHGSTFAVRLPVEYRSSEPGAPPPPLVLEPSRSPVLLIEDHNETRLIYETFLRSSPWQLITACSVREAENLLRQVQPVAIVLDILLNGQDCWDFLAKLKANRLTDRIPVLVATGLDDSQKAFSLGADAFELKPLTAQALRRHLAEWTGPHQKKTVLLVDDQDISRYLLKQLFSNPAIRFLEEADGAAGLQTARAERPDLIVMDLSMPEMSGLEAIKRLKSDPELRDIPVIVATSQVLSAEEAQRLESSVVAILSKESLAQRSVGVKLREMLKPVGLEDLLLERNDIVQQGTL